MTQEERFELGMLLKDSRLFPENGKRILMAALLNRVLSDDEATKLLALLRTERQRHNEIDQEVDAQLQALKTKYNIQ